MKKLLLTALAALSIGSVAMAQKIDNSKDPRYQASDVATNPFQKRALNKGGEAISDWYGSTDMIEQSNVGTSLKGYVDFLVHDSLNKFIEDDGTIRYGGSVSVGHVLDPKDDLIQLTQTPQNQLSRWTSYTLDSIMFRYLYVRNVDSIDDGMGGKASVTDTVFIAYWKGNQIRKSKFTDNTTYAVPSNPWTFATRTPASYYHIDTILLTSGNNGIMDTTRANNNGGFENSWSSKYAAFKAPDGMYIGANGGANTDNLVAYTWTFKSGIPAIVGQDTAVFIYQLDPSTKPANMRRTNYFGYGLFLNEGSTGWDNSVFFNTSLMGMKASSYATTNGWAGYIAGQAFQNERFAETYFKLTVDTTGGKPGAGVGEINNVSSVNVYPNPAKNTINVSFEIAVASDVNVKIVNIMGQEVKALNFGKVSGGKYQLPMDLNNVKPGVYFVTVSAGNTSSTEKLIIAE